MSNSLCPNCNTKGEVINDETLEEDGKKFSEKMHGCHECGHSWTTKTEIEE